MKTQQVCLRGTPDLLLCVAGYFIAIELKRNAKEKPTKLQSWNLERICLAGGIGLAVCPENFEEVFQKISFLAKTGQLPKFKKWKMLEAV